MNDESIGIIGFGGQAREVESFADLLVSFFAVDSDYVTGELIDIDKTTEEHKNTAVVIAIGTPLHRKRLVEKWPGNKFTNVLSKDAIVFKNVELGQGIQVGPGAIVMTGTSVGNHVILNINSTVSHDCKLGDFATISPGANIAGNVTLGDGVFVGVGATISNNISVAEGCVIGAGAVVLENITEKNTVVVGVPAKPVKVNESWLSEI